MNIYDLISRAQKLRKETQLDSVSPDRVGGLHEDTLKYINEFQLLASSPSLHKAYASVSAMQSDKSPKSDLTGKPLKPGQLVVIVPANQTDATAGDVYRYDGPSGNTSAWTFVAKIGAVPADAELSATSTNPPQNKVVTEKLTELESEIRINLEVINAQVEGQNQEIDVFKGNVSSAVDAFKEAVTDQVNNYAPIVINGDVTNAPDEEDLTTENGLLKFKNRSALNGMGYVILRKDKTFAEQVTLQNTIYEIRYDFELTDCSDEFVLPSDSILLFKGGSINNGTLVNNNTEIIVTTPKIFKNNLLIKGFSSLSIDCFETSLDLTSFLNNFKSEGCTIKLGAKSYSADLSNCLLPKNTKICGQGIDRTIISITNSNQSSFMIGMNYGVQLCDLSIECPSDYYGDVLRMSNEFTNSADAKWRLFNVSISSKWTSSNFDDYKATGISILCREHDDDGNIIKQKALSYLRNFNGLKLKNLNIGINVLVQQDTPNLGEDKIWCNSFLFTNLEIWATYGIKFLAVGTDSDTGRFCFKDYMYQGRANTYGYYGNGADNIIMNYLPWDTNYGGYLESGFLFVEYSKGVSEVINGGFFGKGQIYPLSFYLDRVIFKSSNYDGNTFSGVTEISSDGDAIEFKPSNSGKQLIRLKNRYTKGLDAAVAFTDIDGTDKVGQYFNQLENGTAPDSPSGNLVEKRMFYDGYLGKEYAWLETSIPIIRTSFAILQEKYGQISMSVYIARSLQPNSIYRIPIKLMNKNGEEVGVGKDYFTSMEVPVCTGFDNSGTFSILAAQMYTANSYIEVKTDFREFKAGTIKFTFVPRSIEASPFPVYQVQVGEPILVASFVSDNFPDYTSFSNPPTGRPYFRTDYRKPFWRQGTDYYDALGNPFDAKIKGETSERPSDIKEGFFYYDTTINKPIWYAGEDIWVDAMGNEM